EPLPMAAPGAVPTFVSLNNIAKISSRALELWSAALKAAPQARMLVKSPGLTNAQVRDGLVTRFEQLGINRDRIDLLGRSSHVEHLAIYGRCDLALDSYPYH